MWQTAYEQYPYSLLQASWTLPYFTEQTTTGQWSKVINSVQAAKAAELGNGSRSLSPKNKTT